MIRRFIDGVVALAILVVVVLAIMNREKFSSLGEKIAVESRVVNVESEIDVADTDELENNTLLSSQATDNQHITIE
ncbi:MAG: hypothetical protein IKB15_04545 [Alistipes sp.]|nr:hypothetical protein [Alistipes sp.]